MSSEKQHALDFVNWLMEECTLETDESTGDNVLWSYHGEDYSNEGIYEYFDAFQKRTSILPMECNELIESWNNLSQVEKYILGRPNFTCGQIAERMRQIGFECPTKAEMEQALVISSMLKFYDKYGQDWAVKMDEFLKDGK